MVKMVVLLRRAPHLSREQFSAHWRNIHAPLVKSVPELTRYMRKYVQNHIPAAPAADASGRASSSMGGLAQPAPPFDFDGIVEVWYDSVEDIPRSSASQQYADIIRPDELQLIDAARCVMYLVDENVVFDENNRPEAERAR